MLISGRLCSNPGQITPKTWKTVLATCPALDIYGWVQGRGGTGYRVPESTLAGLCVFLSDLDPESKICENRTRIRSHFSISAIAWVCVVISEVKTWVNCNDDCSRSLNRSRILKLKELTDPDSKILEQERNWSLKKWLRSGAREIFTCGAASGLPATNAAMGARREVEEE